MVQRTRRGKIASGFSPSFPSLALSFCYIFLGNRESNEYSWRVSLWNSVTQRVSRDLYLGINEFDSLNVFELNPIKDSESDETFLYVDLVHR